MHLSPKLILLSIFALAVLPNTTLCSRRVRGENSEEPNQQVNPKNTRTLLVSPTKDRPLARRNIKTRPSRQSKLTPSTSVLTGGKDESAKPSSEPSAEGEGSIPETSRKRPPPGAFNVFGAFNPADMVKVLKPTPPLTKLKEDMQPKEETKVPTVKPSSLRRQPNINKEKGSNPLVRRPAGKGLATSSSQGDLKRGVSSESGTFERPKLRKTFSRGQNDTDKTETGPSQFKGPNLPKTQHLEPSTSRRISRAPPKPSQGSQSNVLSDKMSRETPSPSSARKPSRATSSTPMDIDKYELKGPGSMFGVNLRRTFGTTSEKTEQPKSPPITKKQERILRAKPAEDLSQASTDWFWDLDEDQSASKSKETRKRKRDRRKEKRGSKRPALGKGDKPETMWH